MGREMPCIMLFGRPLPDRAPSPEQHEEASQSPPAAKKPRTVRIEMSSASTDEPFRSVALEVPIDSQGQATLHMNAAVQDSADSPASTEVAHPVGGMGSTMVGMVSPSAANMTLPPPAPHGLGTFGLSERDYNSLWNAWRTEGLSVAEMRSCHGPEVAQHVLRCWGPLPLEVDRPPQQACGQSCGLANSHVSYPWRGGPETEAAVQPWYSSCLLHGLQGSCEGSPGIASKLQSFPDHHRQGARSPCHVVGLARSTCRPHRGHQRKQPPACPQAGACCMSSR